MPSQPDTIEIDISDHDAWMSRFDEAPLPSGAPGDQPLPTLPTLLARNFAGKPVPARRWHVEDMIPAGTVTLLYGDGGTGKSLLSLQLAVATALGEEWLGLPTFPGRVLFLSAEDDVDELHRRLFDIVSAMPGAAMADLADLKIVPLAGSDAVLGAVEGGLVKPTPLFRAYAAEASAWKPALIVNDTLADIFAGNENERSQARHFIGMMRGLAIETGAAVILLAHPSLSGLNSGTGTSGSTGWSNSVRSRLYFARATDEEGLEPDPDARVLTTMKANYARKGGSIRLRWEQGVFVPIDQPGPSGSTDMVAAARAERVFLELVDDYNAEKRPVGAIRGSNYAPFVFAKDPRAAGLTKQALTSAMNYLFKARQIEVAEYGPPSKVRKMLRRVTE